MAAARRVSFTSVASSSANNKAGARAAGLVATSSRRAPRAGRRRSGLSVSDLSIWSTAGSTAPPGNSGMRESHALSARIALSNLTLTTAYREVGADAPMSSSTCCAPASGSELITAGVVTSDSPGTAGGIPDSGIPSGVVTEVETPNCISTGGGNNGGCSSNAAEVGLCRIDKGSCSALSQVSAKFRRSVASAQTYRVSSSCCVECGAARSAS
mmetsp:Transcript_19773/g.46378  ORF Transcript_19773/g.46378 Transcript_19773/m.46378 type:complete len:213 (-) Transcript_19773:1416-2054(-)